MSTRDGTVRCEIITGQRWYDILRGLQELRGMRNRKVPESDIQPTSLDTVTHIDLQQEAAGEVNLETRTIPIRVLDNMHGGCLPEPKDACSSRYLESLRRNLSQKRASRAERSRQDADL